ncbi:hypothetical protein ADN00_18285 [Ornatilinea apprima]|uniref:Short-chain dehydrogenase n=1 Tax=Ornatilinea apprima TaxID=1134406 RepID=A0A0P6WK23_9CHLR|nr:SDR family NAD(P)-dependent oxidoreductase [Ornatilinea apprima]KPL70015.1 hypothetical protein ADN00_18285 [Ornatilinea apprima]
MADDHFVDFTGKTVLVTGASAGLGRAVAVRFAQYHARVGVHYHTNRSGAEETARLIEALDGECVLLQADLSQESGVQAMFVELKAKAERLDVLINNAGIYPSKPLMEISGEEWDAMMAANLRSVFLCTRQAAEWMQTRGGGAVVNIASIEAFMPARQHAHYCASKAGVLMLTRSAALELGPAGIRVNAVSPGLIHREGIEENWPEGVERWLKACPLGRMGAPEEVADMCLFLASERASWISGANLVADGGMAVTGAG